MPSSSTARGVGQAEELLTGRHLDPAAIVEDAPDRCARSDVPELLRLARTLDAWSEELPTAEAEWATPSVEVKTGYVLTPHWTRRLRRPKPKHSMSIAESEDFSRDAYIGLAADVQIRQLERSVLAAAALITGLALTTALAGPLLLAGVRRSMWEILFGLVLIAYLATLQRALRALLMVIFTPAGARSGGFLHYADISALGTPSEFSSRVAQMSVDELRQRQLESIAVAAHIAEKKADDLRVAVGWTSRTFVLLVLLVAARFVISVIYAAETPAGIPTPTPTPTPTVALLGEPQYWDNCRLLENCKYGNTAKYAGPYLNN